MANSRPNLPAYAQSLGIRFADNEDGAPVVCVDFDRAVEGRPGHLHGGAISGLLETAGYALLSTELTRAGRPLTMKPINITVQFLAAGKRETTFAKARLTKLGRRTANIAVEAWQTDPDRPVASAIMNVMVQE